MKAATSAILALVLSVLAAVASAQGRFDPVIRVDDAVITRWQLDQRTQFLTLLNAPDAATLARQQLINEAIQLRAAERAGIVPSADAIGAGIAEFAGRANLSGEQFIEALAQNGVEPETFRDFVTAGVAWRDYVRNRFGESARDVPRDQVARTLAQTGTEGGTRVLFSEVVLPADSPETAAASRIRAAQVAALRDPEAFATAARKYSIAPSSAAGGARGWAGIEQLPPEIAAVISGLAEGQVSRPLELGGTIAIYLLRDREVVAGGPATALAVDYALFTVAGGRPEAEAVARRIDTCDDLYGVAKGLPPERLIRETLPVSSLPADIRAEIARLDPSETSTGIVRGGAATVLMLCERSAGLESDVDQTIILNRLVNQRLGASAANHLADLRARARIVEFGG